MSDLIRKIHCRLLRKFNWILCSSEIVHKFSGILFASNSCATNHLTCDITVNFIAVMQIKCKYYLLNQLWAMWNNFLTKRETFRFFFGTDFFCTAFRFLNKNKYLYDTFSRKKKHFKRIHSTFIMRLFEIWLCTRNNLIQATPSSTLCAL